MELDQVGAMIKNHDYVVELDEEFALHGPSGKNLEYGIVFGEKWILPLGGTSKKQILSATCVKLLNHELDEEIKAKLDALYVYYRKYEKLPDPEEDIVTLMAEDVSKYRLSHGGYKPVFCPFVRDFSEPETDGEEVIEEDDLGTNGELNPIYDDSEVEDDDLI